jgi:hypothetical protein
MVKPMVEVKKNIKKYTTAFLIFIQMVALAPAVFFLGVRVVVDFAVSTFANFNFF